MIQEAASVQLLHPYCLAPFCLQCRASRKVKQVNEAQTAVTEEGKLGPELPFVLHPQVHESLARGCKLGVSQLLFSCMGVGKIICAFSWCYMGLHC